MSNLRGLHRVPVRLLPEVEAMRQIRNRCKDGFSSYTEEISPAEQIAWWTHQGDKVRAWLYEDDLANLVGFGCLRRDAEGRWLTVVAVLPEFGGLGYGKAITHDIVMRSPGRCWATARKDNPAAVKLHIEADWDVVDGPDERLVYFRGKRNPEAEDARAHWIEHGWALT